MCTCMCIRMHMCMGLYMHVHCVFVCVTALTLHGLSLLARLKQAGRRTQPSAPTPGIGSLKQNKIPCLL